MYSRSNYLHKFEKCPHIKILFEKPTKRTKINNIIGVVFILGRVQRFNVKRLWRTLQYFYPEFEQSSQNFD